MKLNFRTILSSLILFILGGCTIFPKEMNFSPLYRHRLNKKGEVLSMDILWPLIHYEAKDDGSWDFRVRPLYRKEVKADPKEETHQFLHPFGRVAIKDREKHLRFFPVINWRSHVNDKGKDDVDWYFLFPLFWGGYSDDHEDYFAFFPLYGKIPQFLSYEEAGWFLFPLYVWSEKRGAHTRSLLWPFFGIGWGDNEGDPSWLRALPFYAQSKWPGHRWHRSFLWPFFHIGQENLAGKDPRNYWFLFPLFGLMTGQDTLSWSFLWPFFRYHSRNSDSFRWDGPWPFLRIHDEKTGSGEKKEHLHQWWLAPFYSSTDISDVTVDAQGRETEKSKHWSRVLLQPLIWFNEHREDHLESEGTYFLPFYWSSHTKRLVGGNGKRPGKERWTTRLYPLLSVERDNKPSKTLHIPDPIPFYLNHGEGYRENYDFIWNLFTYMEDGDRVSITTPVDIFCYDEAEGTTTWSIPFLFHVEKGPKKDITLRLFHIFPIRFK